jgi:hypothetical protein
VVQLERQSVKTFAYNACDLSGSATIEMNQEGQGSLVGRRIVRRGLRKSQGGVEKCSSMAQQLYSTSGTGWARYPLTRFDTSTWIPGSNWQAVDRLDESVENPKM